MKLRSEKNLNGSQERSAEAGPASEALMDPFEEGEQTLIRPEFDPGEDLERKEVERTEEALFTARRRVNQGNVQIRDQE